MRACRTCEVSHKGAFSSLLGLDGATLSIILGSGYFASRGKIAPCYFAIWRQNSPNGYFASSAKITLSLILTQTLNLTQTITLILTLIPTLTLTLTQTLTQTEEKHYFASRGKIATSIILLMIVEKLFQISSPESQYKFVVQSTEDRSSQ